MTSSAGRPEVANVPPASAFGLGVASGGATSLDEGVGMHGSDNLCSESSTELRIGAYCSLHFPSPPRAKSSFAAGPLPALRSKPSRAYWQPLGATESLAEGSARVRNARSRPAKTGAGGREIQIDRRNGTEMQITDGECAEITEPGERAVLLQQQGPTPAGSVPAGRNRPSQGVWWAESGVLEVLKIGMRGKQPKIQTTSRRSRNGKRGVRRLSF